MKNFSIAQEESMPTTKTLANIEPNWMRSIHINKSIDDDTVRQLAPSILQMRQKGNNPITVGIDSLGGSIASLDAIQSLLRGPTAKAERGTFITVVTRRAFSAAAILLASGDYSVAMKHSEILFHDIRYSNLDDVTPDSARDAARKLQHANDQAALKLAHFVTRRILYGYISLISKFGSAQAQDPKRHENFSNCIYPDTRSEQKPIFDIPLYATCVHRELSERNKIIIDKIIEGMASFNHSTHISKLIKKQARGSKDASKGLEFIRGLIQEKKNRKNLEAELTLFMTVLGAKIKEREFDGEPLELRLEEALREYSTLQTINNSKHIRSAANGLLDFGVAIKLGFGAGEPKKISASEKNKLDREIEHSARLLWLFCLILCRELLTGEWVLTPSDAQLLGLVDEVYGGGAYQSMAERFAERLRVKNQEKRKATR
jgi:ATP-dependent protease ClpP protease subunit